jgi:cytochrome c oxidase assembly protein subunit 15
MASPAGSLALILVIFQIALGGWVSSNYAARLSDFCVRANGALMDFGWLHPAPQRLHRPPARRRPDGNSLEPSIGALRSFAVGTLALALLRNKRAGRFWGWTLIGLLGLQLGLGIANVLLSLPLPLAVAHNLGAAALLSATLAINIRLHQTKSPWQD